MREDRTLGFAIRLVYEGTAEVETSEDSSEAVTTFPRQMFAVDMSET